MRERLSQATSQVFDDGARIVKGAAIEMFSFEAIEVCCGLIQFGGGGLDVF